MFWVGRSIEVSAQGGDSDYVGCRLIADLCIDVLLAAYTSPHYVSILIQWKRKFTSLFSLQKMCYAVFRESDTRLKSKMKINNERKIIKVQALLNYFHEKRKEKKICRGCSEWHVEMARWFTWEKNLKQLWASWGFQSLSVAGISVFAGARVFFFFFAKRVC